MFSAVQNNLSFTGLGLISMGISLMQEQVIGKIQWCVNEMGIRETEEDRVERYIIKKHYNIVRTPQDKNTDQRHHNPR